MVTKKEIEHVLQSIDYNNEKEKFCIYKKNVKKGICFPDLIINKIIYYTYTYDFTSKEQLLYALNSYPHNIKYYGDISYWNVSMITDMNLLFSYYSNFNGNISQWDVSNVKFMNAMFYMTKKFNGDISKWDVSNVIRMQNIFYRSDFKGDISKWAVKPSGY